MKLLIWFLCFLVYSLIIALFSQFGITLGAFPAALLFFCAVALANKLCRKHVSNKSASPNPASDSTASFAFDASQGISPVSDASAVSLHSQSALQRGKTKLFHWRKNSEMSPSQRRQNRFDCGRRCRSFKILVCALVLSFFVCIGLFAYSLKLTSQVEYLELEVYFAGKKIDTYLQNIAELEEEIRQLKIDLLFSNRQSSGN